MGSLAALLAAALLSQTRPLPPQPAPSISGVWTLNKDLSDAPRSGGEGRDSGDRGGNRGYGGGRGGGRGGYGGRGMGRGGGGGGGAAAPRSPEEMARMRDAMRDVIDPPERLTIVQTDSMVLVTGADGRTVRLSPDGKKVKDENTGVERKTKWDGGKLVSEISGLGPGKMTQTLSVDPETRQLHITVLVEGGGSREPRTISHVYDREEQQ